MVTPPGSTSSGSRSVSNSSYMETQNTSSPVVTSQIPVLLSSIETLRFLEIQQPHAIQIWNAFRTNIFQGRAPEDSNLLMAAKDHILYRIHGDCSEENDDWTGLFSAMGMATSFVDRVMDPTFKHMRLMSSAKAITTMYLEDRWEFLETVGERITAPPKKAGRRVASIGQNANPITHSGKVTAATGNPSSSESSQTLVESSTAVPTAIPGHRTLYKGGAQARLERILNPNGTLNMTQALSSESGDFSPITGLYLTKQYKVAYEYARWAARIVDGRVVPVGILQIVIPEFLLESSYEVVGDEWKNFVYVNSKGVSSRYGEFAHLEDYKWLVGAICHQSQDKFLKNKVSDVQQVEVWSLSDPGEVTSQHYTKSLGMIASLDRECSGKVWISTLELSKA